MATTLTSTGITFPDSTTQTTAAGAVGYPSVSAGTIYSTAGDGNASTTSGTVTKMLTMRMTCSGTVRVYWLWNNGATTAYTRIYKNGVAVSSLYTKAANPYPTSSTYDISVSVGDFVQIYGYTANTDYNTNIVSTMIGVSASTFIPIIGSMHPSTNGQPD